MKKIIVFTFFVFATSFGFAQNVSGNTVSNKEKAPIWPGCEEASSTSNCFNQKLSQHIAQNYKFPKEYTEADKGTKVVVSFVIDENGEPQITKVTGGKKYLQDEAKRNILAIPKMKPGSLDGKPRAIKYTVPFKF
ncbi:energy transducer TonB [Mesonia sp. K7]|uniref:energy transducer TonB n=1 Tax=Mesonia sp. K7 TaxID=2218606 RepID=UPI000DAA1EE1|nr:energy transducer TonB [Mesonia sp. K7]PZD78641.1 energy transducer TonB [Mesonia sp. K7]